MVICDSRLNPKFKGCENLSAFIGANELHWADVGRELCITLSGSIHTEEEWAAVVDLAKAKAGRSIAGCQLNNLTTN